MSIRLSSGYQFNDFGFCCQEIAKNNVQPNLETASRSHEIYRGRGFRWVKHCKNLLEFTHWVNKYEVNRMICTRGKTAFDHLLDVHDHQSPGALFQVLERHLNVQWSYLQSRKPKPRQIKNHFRIYVLFSFCQGSIVFFRVYRQIWRYCGLVLLFRH